MAPAVPLVMRYCSTNLTPRGGSVVRITSLKLSILAAVLMAFAIVPAASATTFDVFQGTTLVATATVTTGGSCAANSICVTLTGVGGNQIRTGGPTVGFSGTSLSGLGISLYSGSGTIAAMGRHILVDDDQEIRTLLAEYLERNGSGCRRSPTTRRATRCTPRWTRSIHGPNSSSPPSSARTSSRSSAMRCAPTVPPGASPPSLSS